MEDLLLELEVLDLLEEEADLDLFDDFFRLFNFSCSLFSFSSFMLSNVFANINKCSTLKRFDIKYAVTVQT